MYAFGKNSNLNLGRLTDAGRYATGNIYPSAEVQSRDGVMGHARVPDFGQQSWNPESAAFEAGNQTGFLLDSLNLVALAVCIRENVGYVETYGRKEKPGVPYSRCCTLLNGLAGNRAPTWKANELRAKTLAHFDVKRQGDFVDMILLGGLRPLWHFAITCGSKQEL